MLAVVRTRWKFPLPVLKLVNVLNVKPTIDTFRVKNGSRFVVLLTNNVITRFNNCRNGLFKKIVFRGGGGGCSTLIHACS